MRSASTIATVTFCVFAASHALADGYSFTLLSDPSGETLGVSASNISADGSVIVGVSNAVGAFRWTNSGGMVDLGDLPGGSQSDPYAVSADGSVIVGIGFNASAVREAFRWTSAEGMVGLGHLPGKTFVSYAADVSADGSVIVGASGSGPSENYEAFRWTSAAGMVGLGDLPGGEFYGHAEGVSGDGSVVVGRSNSAFLEVFRWTSSAGMVGLGFTSSYAPRVSADGAVIVGDHLYDAIRWTSSEGIVPLGSLSSSESSATDVSADGSVIVGNIGTDAFVWTPGGGMMSLRQLFNSQGFPCCGGAIYARAVSADGRTIVGGTSSAQSWVVTIPDLPGDYNGNGRVDAADYVAWRKGLGTIYTQTDYSLWKANFGASFGSIATTFVGNVPEPAALGMRVLSLSAICTFRARKPRSDPRHFRAWRRTK